jgi:phosphate binding protein
MLKTRIVALVALMAILMSPVAGVLAQADDIVSAATKAGNFKTLVTAIKAAGLEETLKGAGPFTVFAPTDEAFAKVPKIALDYLMKPENKELLARIINYHVIAGDNAADKVMDAATLKTVEGGELKVTVVDKAAKINSANITKADMKASNGLIHAIDAVVLPEIKIPEVDPLAVQGNILTAGSSTVFPLARRIADNFRKDGFAGNIEVASVGTGAGFERFCKAGETDISNASARISKAQLEDCAKIKREPVEFYVAIDALAVVVSKQNTFVKNLTKAQLADIFSGKADTWDKVDPSYPKEAIRLFSPGTDSGTFDYFVEAIFKKDKNLILNAKGIQLSEDDNVLVQGVEGSQFAIGYFGYAYYQPNAEKLNALSIEGVAPSEETAESGQYPLSRPLFIYSTAQIMQEKPQVAAFISYFLANASNELGTAKEKINYFDVSADALNLDKLLFLAATPK